MSTNPDDLPQLLRYYPFPIPDPGPPWLRQLLDKDLLLKLAVVHLQLEKEVLTSRAKAIDSQIQLLARKTG
jgi:hypothetical protein